MSSNEDDAEFRGKMIATLKSLNHNDDVIWKKLNKLDSKVNKHCVSDENRVSTLESNYKSLEKQFNVIVKVLIGLFLTVIGTAITVIVKLTTM